MMPSKIFTAIAVLVICSHSLTVANEVDDEFAEFDDLPHSGESLPVPSDSSKQIKEHPATKEPTSKSSPVDFSPFDNGESRDDVKTDKRPELKLVDAPLSTIYYRWESYYIEIAFIFIGALYFVNYFIGSSKNSKLALNVYEKSRDLLKEQFSLVGGSPQVNEGGKKSDDDADQAMLAFKKQRGLVRFTDNLFTLWNSGRVGMDGLLIEVNLLKRQDLFSMALNILRPTTDSLILRFLLNQDGYENFVFCIANKNQAPKLAKELVDINTFCPKRKPISQHGVDSERLFVMSELSDVASFILDQSTNSFLAANDQLINFLHITDQYSTLKAEDLSPALKLANPKRMATFSFKISQKTSDSVEFIRFALNLLDRLRRFKLAKDSKQKSDKNRQKIAEILQKTAFSQRQERAQLKKEELRRLEKERILNEDDPEKQRRWEQKEAKRELKKNKMRVKQLKVKSM